MSGIFDFKRRFGQEIKIDEIKKDFINKICHLIIEPLDSEVGILYNDRNKAIFDFVAIEFSYKPSDLIEEDHYSNDSFRKPFTFFSNNEFEKTLLLVEILYNYFLHSNNYNKEKWLEKINKTIVYALRQPISLGVTWREGKFYPEGAKEFEDKLITEVLKWLEEKPKVKALYNNALDHYSQSLNDPIKRKDVISNAFQAVEKLTKEYLITPKESFDNNFNALVGQLELDKEWKKIFNSYRELSKEFGRHAGGNANFIPTQEDTEAFLYLSGLIMRLILQKNNDLENKKTR